MDATSAHVEDVAMDVDAVVGAVKLAEEAAAMRWCRDRAPGTEARQALRALVADMERSEGGGYELAASGLCRSSRILLLSLCGRYRLPVIRRKRQRKNTMVIVGPQTFLEEVLWPMFAQQAEAIVAAHDQWLLEVLADALPE